MICISNVPICYSIDNLQITERVMETPAAKKQRMEINGGENGFGLDVGINYSESSVSLSV